MKKCLAVFCVLLAVLLSMTALSCGAAEEYEPLRVFFHDVLTMKYEVVGGSGQYEVVSQSLTDKSGATVTPGDLKPYSYYYAAITVRDLVTGETASANDSDHYGYTDYWSCKKGYHNAYGSEDLGERPHNTTFVDVEYLNITQTEHTVKRITAYRCIDCSVYMFSEETSIVEQHRYNPNTGTCVCGKYDDNHVCTHANINDEDFYIESYEIIDDEHHKEILYKNLVCDDCGYHLGSEFWKEQTTTHFFFTGNNECKCGYRKAPECRHMRTTQTFVGTTYTPGETDTAIHWAEPNYKITCLDCGFVRDETWPGLAEAHEYDENGTCICGIHISLECAHERTEEALISTSYTPSETDAGMHWAVPNYQIACLDCGAVRDETGDRQQEPHAFDENGYCGACGFQIDPAEITEPLEVTVSAWSRNALVYDRVGAEATVSGGSGIYAFHWGASSDALKYVQSRPNYPQSSWGFNANSADTWQISVTVTDQVTGEMKTAYSGEIIVKEPCQHTGGRLEESTKDYMEYESVHDDNIHVAWHVIEHTSICADCGEMITEKERLYSQELHGPDTSRFCEKCGDVNLHPLLPLLRSLSATSEGLLVQHDILKHKESVLNGKVYEGGHVYEYANNAAVRGYGAMFGNTLSAADVTAVRRMTLAENLLNQFSPEEPSLEISKKTYDAIVSILKTMLGPKLASQFVEMGDLYLGGFPLLTQTEYLNGEVTWRLSTQEDINRYFGSGITKITKEGTEENQYTGDASSLIKICRTLVEGLFKGLRYNELDKEGLQVVIDGLKESSDVDHRAVAQILQDIVDSEQKMWGYVFTSMGLELSQQALDEARDGLLSYAGCSNPVTAAYVGAIKVGTWVNDAIFGVNATQTAAFEAVWAIDLAEAYKTVYREALLDFKEDPAGEYADFVRVGSTMSQLVVMEYASVGEWIKTTDTSIASILLGGLSELNEHEKTIDNSSRFINGSLFNATHLLYAEYLRAMGVREEHWPTAMKYADSFQDIYDSIEEGAAEAGLSPDE